MHPFKAEIYKTGINAAVDVPAAITEKMQAVKGYIRIEGIINGFRFRQTLVPVKNAPYRLFVNIPMLKGGKTAVGQTAEFAIKQDFSPVEDAYPMVEALSRQLEKKGLTAAFESLTGSRKKDILKYLSYIKTEATLQKNIEKVVMQLQNGENARIP
jgi:hypothetical protein